MTATPAARQVGALGALARRARGGARARGAALGAALARADDRPLRGGVRRAAVGAPYAAAVSSGTAGLHLLCVARGHRAGRRGDHVAVLVRRVGELRDLRGRGAGVRRHRPADAATSTRRRSRRRSRRGRRRSSRSTSSATRASSTSCARSANGTGLTLVEDACEALGARYEARRSARTARPRSGRSIRTSRSRRARAASSRPTRRRRGGCSRAPQPGPRRRRRLARPRPARLQLPDRRRPAAIGIGQLEKLDRILAGRARVADAVRRAARRDRGRRAPAAPTTTTTSARGSSTSSSSRTAQTARR